MSDAFQNIRGENNLNDFRVTKDRRVLLDGMEIPRCIGFNISIEAGKDPEVTFRVSCGSVAIEDYTDQWPKGLSCLVVRELNQKVRECGKPILLI